MRSHAARVRRLALGGARSSLVCAVRPALRDTRCPGRRSGRHCRPAVGGTDGPAGRRHLNPDWRRLRHRHGRRVGSPHPGCQPAPPPDPSLRRPARAPIQDRRSIRCRGPASDRAESAGARPVPARRGPDASAAERRGRHRRSRLRRVEPDHGHVVSTRRRVQLLRRAGPGGQRGRPWRGPVVAAGGWLRAQPGRVVLFRPAVARFARTVRRLACEPQRRGHDGVLARQAVLRAGIRFRSRCQLAKRTRAVPHLRGRPDAPRIRPADSRWNLWLGRADGSGQEGSGLARSPPATGSWPGSIRRFREPGPAAIRTCLPPTGGAGHISACSSCSIGSRRRRTSLHPIATSISTSG